jgi:hypothetical protein
VNVADLVDVSVYLWELAEAVAAACFRNDPTTSAQSPKPEPLSPSVYDCLEVNEPDWVD